MFRRSAESPSVIPLLYARPRRRKRNVFPLVLALLFAFVFLALMISLNHEENQTTALATGPKAVWGYIFDESGAPVVGAHVNVSIWNGLAYRSGHDTDSIDDGFYVWDFTKDEWENGYVIKVAATWGPYEGTNSTTADGTSDQQIDVRMMNTIPEFGTVPLALPTFGVIILMVFLSFCAKRR